MPERPAVLLYGDRVSDIQLSGRRLYPRYIARNPEHVDNLYGLLGAT